MKKEENTYISLLPKNWIIADAVSNDKPCNLFIDSLEDAVIFQIGKDFDYLSNQPHRDHRCYKRNFVFCLSAIKQIEVLAKKMKVN
jgi:hypothetical protein|tara:strand:+ start:509 stop:766 length:258 start_codon:yes stop_codon:yes gene_type:complete